MFCDKCGAALEDGAMFCSSCGEKCQVENTPTQANSRSNYPGGNSSNYPKEEALSSNYTANNATSSNYPGGNAVGANYPSNEQVPVTLEEESSDAMQGSLDTAESEVLVPVKKKGKFLRIFIPVAAIIVLLTSAVLVFGRTIFFAVAPEAYVAKLIQSTGDELALEMNQIEENVFGFDITMDNEMTAGISVDYNDADGDFKFNFNIANDPKNEKLLADVDFENDGGKASGYGYLDNENAGLMLPGSDGKYLSVPSKDFGKHFKESDGFMNDYMSRDTGDGREDAYDLIKGLDLSYSNIKQAFSTDKDTAKRVNKHVADNVIELLKQSEIGKREKVDYEFDGKTVSAYEIPLTVNQDDIRDCLVKIYEAIGDDDKIKTAVDYSSLVDIIDELDDENTGTDYSTKMSDYGIKLVEYKGKIVSVTIEYTEDIQYRDSSYVEPSYNTDHSYNEKDTYILTISTTDRKKLLNGITVKQSREDDINYKDENSDDGIRKYETEVSMQADWANKRKKKDDDIINVNFVSSHSYNYDDTSGYNYSYSTDGTLEFIMDFEKEKWELDYDTVYKDDDGDKNKESYSFDGKCSKDDGFSFTVNEKWEDTAYEYEYNMTYSEWIEDEFDTYRDDYLEDVYYDRFYYDYDSYYDWYYSDSRDVWDVADSDFKNWLYDEHYYYYNDLYDAYEREAHTEKEIPVDAYAKVTVTLKNKVDVKSKDGKNNSILDWSEDDFYDFGDAFIEETEK